MDVLLWMYYFGKGVTIDYKEASYYYQKAAEAGNSDGMFNLGICYYSGKGTPYDAKKGMYWLKEAASEGSSKSMYQLGLTYYYSEGFEKETFYWLKKVIESGYTEREVYYLLARCYYYGKGTSQDYEQAFFYFRKDIENRNDYTSMNYVDLCMKKGKE